jgi:hypothetical protein
MSDLERWETGLGAAGYLFGTDPNIREYDSTLAEGSGHGGMSALIDLVGVK